MGKGQTNVPGAILDVGTDSIQVQTADAVVGLRDLLDAEHRPISARELQQRLGFQEKDVLD